MLSNQHADDLLWLHKPDEAPDFRREGAVNLLYPHWGNELEAWPRKPLVELGHAFARHYDAIIGHHAHNPQPVEVHGGVPIAYGLGDFCFFYNLPTYRHGVIIRIELGRPKGGGLPHVRALHWDPVVNLHQKDVIRVDIAERAPDWLC
jgi:hypothetical protein